jgi:hypothetical protein
MELRIGAPPGRSAGRPGVAERLGLGYEGLAADNPRLVYVSVSGFGSRSPYAELPAYDSVIPGDGGLHAVPGRRRRPAARALHRGRQGETSSPIPTCTRRARCSRWTTPGPDGCGCSRAPCASAAATPGCGVIPRASASTPTRCWPRGRRAQTRPRLAGSGWRGAGCRARACRWRGSGAVSIPRAAPRPRPPGPWCRTSRRHTAGLRGELGRRARARSSG